MSQPELPLLPDEITLPYVERLLTEQEEHIVAERNGIVGYADLPMTCPIACLLTFQGFDEVRVTGEDTFFEYDGSRTTISNTTLVRDLIGKIDGLSMTLGHPVSIAILHTLIEEVKTNA